MKKYKANFDFWYQAYSHRKNPIRFIKAVAATYF